MSEERSDERQVVRVIGCGGVGFWLATALSRSGYRVYVYDDDNLTGGLGHQRLPSATPSTRKVDLLTGFIRLNFNREVPEVVAARFTGKEAQPGDLVVDCSDMPGDVRRRVWSKARKAGARCLRVSYDGAASVVVVAEGLPLVGNERAAGYASVPSLPLSFMAGGMGAEVVRLMIEHQLTVDHVEFQVSVADFVKVREVAA